MASTESFVLTQPLSRLLSGSGYPGISQPFSQYSVLFDGANDYAQSYAVTRPDATIASRTYSFWAKASDTAAAARSTVFSHGAYYKSAFYFNWSSSRPLLYQNSGHYRYWDDTSAQDDGNWHHWMVYADATSSNNAKLYIDGVLQGVNATSTSSSPAYHNTNGIFVGYGYSPQAGHFDGNLDEFAIFAGDATPHASAIYNNGRPADLSRFSPEHWWRMGDSGRDPTIIDQVTPTVGPDLVANGTFDATVSGGWDDWDNNLNAADASQSGGVGILDSSTSSISATQDVTVVVGKLYEVTVTAHYVAPATWTWINIGDGVTAYAYAAISPDTTPTRFTKHVAATTTTLRIACHNDGVYGAGEGHFDDIAVRELSGTPLYLPNGGPVEVDAP